MDQPLSIKQQREQKHAAKLTSRLSTERSRQHQRFWLWGGGIIGLGLLIWGAWFLAQPSTKTTPGNSQTTLAMQADDFVRGNRDAKAVLIEYSDFQCPACQSYEPMVQSVTEKYGDQLALVYRNYPLTTIHKNAQLAAQAAVAAAQQGDFFWAYHDMLFDRHDTWAEVSDPRTLFIGYAQELGMNTEQFKKDIDRDTVKQKIKTDIQRGNDSHIPGTPTFYLNGASINPQSVDDFSHLIDGVLAK